MITILIRTSNRPTQFKRCIDSILNQTYTDWKVIVCFDGDDYVPEHDNITKFPAPNHERKYYFWNLFCNDLKDKVNEGHFFFLDDDDELLNKDTLLNLSKKKEDKQSYICRMTRNSELIPSKKTFKNQTIKRGQIGMPCFVLWHDHKNIVYFDNQKASDFRFIDNLSKLINLEWINEVLVKVNGENKGRKEYQ
jgi:glycosyltransferase involved in cell wall biosynthesis